MATKPVNSANGIVRKVDDLGRIVLAKELRKLQGIREGDCIEQFVGTDGELVIRKFSPIATLEDIARENVKVLQEMIELPVLVADTNKVLVAEGEGAGRYLNRPLSDGAADLIYANKMFLAGQKNGLQAVEQMAHEVLLQVPITSDEMKGGAIIVLAEGKGATLDSNVLELTCMTAKLIGNRMNWEFV